MYPLKMCTDCIKESSFIRKVWEFDLFTACPTHKRLLIDKCPGCGKGLSWLREKVVRCRCGYDLRDTNPLQVNENELRVATHLQALLIGNSQLMCSTTKDHSPFWNLGIADFTDVLYFFARYCEGDKNDPTNTSQPVGTLLSHHNILVQATNIFDDWPDNYIGFLENIRGKVNGRGELDTGITKDFGSFRRLLYKNYRKGECRFLIETFERYLADYWDGGYLTTKCRGVGEEDLKERKWVPASIVADRLGISPDAVVPLVEREIIKGVIRPMGKRRLCLVDSESLDEAVRLFKSTLTMKEVAKRINIKAKHVIIGLVRADILKLLRGPEVDNYHHRIFLANSVDVLFAKIKALVPIDCHEKNTVNFHVAIRMLSRTDYGKVDTLLMAIFNEKIRIVGWDENCGLAGLQFSIEDLRHVLDGYRMEEHGGITLEQAAMTLGISYTKAKHLVKKGILDAQRVSVGNRNEWSVGEESIDSCRKILDIEAEHAGNVK
jgi:hypothetical protein